MSKKSAMKKPPKQKVAIIGAGVAGCAMAGALQDYGVEFEVFDQNEGPGGLWTNNYPGASVQSTSELYEYPGKKFPDHIRNRKDPPGPTAAEVCNYLDEYIDEKGMRSKFYFRTKIASIQCNGETEWLIEFEDLSTKEYTFVVVCTGLVSTKPRMVNIPGKALFVANGGQILHSSERRSDDIFVGKRVLVVGNGKSAVDAAVAAAVVAEENGTAPPIQMARRQTWYVPRYILGLIQYKWVFHTRLGCSLLPAYYETSKFWKAIHYVLSPLKWMTWRIVELLLLCQYHLPPRLWPKLRTIEGATLDNSVLITDNKHLRRLRKKQVDMRIGEVSSLKPGKAVLNNGEEEDVDVIIMATGWSLGFDLFMDSDFILAGLDFKGGLDFNQDGLWCYRNILPTEFKGLAFVGSNSLTFMNIYTAYIQSYWLAQLLAGVRSWPKEEQMKMTVDREKKWKRTLYTHCNDMRGASIEAYMQHYHDVLFREMNASEPFNCLIRPVANLIIPVIPSLMAGCLTPSNVVKYPRASNHDAKNESFERDSMENGSKTPSPSSVASVDSNSSVRVDMTGECLTTASPDPTAAANA